LVELVYVALRLVKCDIFQDFEDLAPGLFDEVEDVAEQTIHRGGKIQDALNVRSDRLMLRLRRRLVFVDGVLKLATFCLEHALDIQESFYLDIEVAIIDE